MKILLNCTKFVLLVFTIVTLAIVKAQESLNEKHLPTSKPHSGDALTELSHVVPTVEGLVEGIPLISRRGNEYVGYLGIPYAKISARFMPPESIDKWQGVFHANKQALPCYQFDAINQQFTGSEDCLTLNIYTPKLKGNLPVIFYIHGGGFQVGSGNNYGAKYLMDASVVLVTINYRLGALGFLNLEDENILGNMGLKDQVKALEWVQQNIHNFGGDPKKVLLYGNSAGGSSVHFHMLSELSKGIFSAAFSNSGTALNSWAFQDNPRKTALRLVDKLKCSSLNSTAVVECLRSKSPREVLKAQSKLRDLPYQYDVRNMIFVPSKEVSAGSGQFLLETPHNLIVNNQVTNKVPWLVSVSRDEGLFWTTPYLNDKKLVERLNKEWEQMAPKIFFYDTEASEVKKKVSKAIWDLYLKDGKINRRTRRNVSEIYTDRYIINGVMEAINLHKTSGSSFPIYMSLFNYSGVYSVIQDTYKVKKFYEIAHSDELHYIFNQTHGAPEYEAGTPVGDFSEKLVQLIASFAKNGKPTSTWSSQLIWDPIRGDKISDMKLYEINRETKLVDNMFAERYQFWTELFKEQSEQIKPDAQSNGVLERYEHTEL